MIEPNWVFKILYAAMKIFMSKAQLDKIKMLGGLPELKEWIDEDQLWPEHGGTCTLIFDPIKAWGLKPE